MNKKVWDCYFFSVAVILFVTAVAKIFSATGSADALQKPDPGIPLSNRQVFYLVSALELALSAFLLLRQGNQMLKASLIAWLSTNYLAYRAVLWWTGAPIFCDCLGNLNDKFFISPQIINLVMLALLAWLMAGSCVFLSLEWFRRWRDSSFKTIGVRTEGVTQLGNTHGH